MDESNNRYPITLEPHRIVVDIGGITNGQYDVLAEILDEGIDINRSIQ